VKTDWIVAVMAKVPGAKTQEAHWHCRRCDAFYVMNMPVELGTYIAAMKAWAKPHRHCVKRKDK